MKGARVLVEAGYEYVKDFDDGLMLFRKRKRNHPKKVFVNCEKFTKTTVYYSLTFGVY